ncbi:hypothetical protein K7711_23000 [Nocardia sp. CA2R105]|uniref:hypothetical protein n=1 Tax=Nocardia coffeae TaxID=2873381 RepID=UPI001CA610A5|nr:hypothetical protein [Nocardia coffeae]MBY8859355.1 hypothetical protein [Nocardia coffeae]
MTPFMLAVQELLDGTPAPEYRTEDSRPQAVAAATHVQVEIRSLAEQLVCEANAILAAQSAPITLVDDSGPGQLAFTLGCGDRSARVQTSLTGRTAVAQLLISGRAEHAPRRLTGEDELRALLLSLLATPTAH